MEDRCRASSGMEGPSGRVTYPPRRYSRKAWHGDAPRCLDFSIAAFSTGGERADRGARMTADRWLAEIERVGTRQGRPMHPLFAELIFAHPWDSMDSQRCRSLEAPRGGIPRNTINPRAGLITRPPNQKGEWP